MVEIIKIQVVKSISVEEYDKMMGSNDEEYGFEEYGKIEYENHKDWNFNRTTKRFEKIKTLYKFN